MNLSPSNGHERDYYSWVDNETRENLQEVHREEGGRFATTPKPAIRKSRLQFDGKANCGYCGNPIFPSETLFFCDVSFVIGCSEEHCRDIAQAKLDYHTES